MQNNPNNITSADQARQYAIDWSKWVGDQNLSYGELAEWQATFILLANRYGLRKEFKENGII